MGHLTFCVVVALVFIPKFVVPQDWAFNCRRRDTTCFTGTTCRLSGTNEGSCDCGTTGRTSYNCGLVLSEIIITGCLRNCARGTCYRTPNAADRCYCPTDYSGELCEKKRVRVIACTETTMTVNINPNANFAGKIYVKGHSNTQACLLPASTDTTNPGYLRSLSRVDGPSNPCRGTGFSRTTSSTGKVSTQYVIIVQHDVNILHPHDEQHTVTCDGNGDTVYSVSLTNIGTEGPGGTGGLDGTTSTFEGDMQLVLKDATGNPTQGPYYIGQQLKIEASASATSKAKFFRMTKCTASSVARRSLVMLDNSCITSDGTYSGVSKVEKIDSSVVMSFQVFRFEGSVQLSLSCEFNMCIESTDPNCAQVTCPGGASGVGRRRRQAEESQTANVTQKLYVLLNTQELYDLLDKREEQVTKTYETCFHDAFIIVAALVGILLFIVVILLLLICLRVRSRKVTKEVAEYTNDGANRM